MPPSPPVPPLPPLPSRPAVATLLSEMPVWTVPTVLEAVARILKSSLAEGVLYVPRLFHSAFATKD
ncbi:predicted protein [Mycobacterium tuberculosis T85]|nr:predicted protein [Mycobacterium tuberculosis T85]